MGIVSTFEKVAEVPHAFALVGARHRFGQLTRREREVLLLVAKGLSNIEISKVLFVEVGTIKRHIHGMLTKLDVRDRLQAVMLAHEIGYLPPPQQPDDAGS